jgi:hypothetical protein
LIENQGLLVSRINGVYEVIYGDAVDFCQSYQLIDRQFVFTALKAGKPTGRDSVGQIATLSGNAATSLLNLSQGESPLLANCSQP